MSPSSRPAVRIARRPLGGTLAPPADRASVPGQANMVYSVDVVYTVDMTRYSMVRVTAEGLRLLRLVAAITGEKQYEVIERLLGRELARLKEEGKLP
jgi:hypothetical protein